MSLPRYPWGALYPYDGDPNSEALDQSLRETRGFVGDRPARRPTESQFGRSTTVTAADDGQAKPLLQCRIGMAVPWMVSIDHSVVQRDENSPAQGVDQQLSFIRARWGAGGAAHQADIDVRNGTSFVVFGSFVELTAHVAFPVALLGTQVNPVEFRATAVPVQGSVPAMGFATRTLLLFPANLPFGTPSNTLEVPQYAADWQLLFNGGAGAGANVDRDVQFSNQAGTSVGLFPIRTNANRTNWDATQWLPVPAEATRVSVLNSSGSTNLSRPTICFRLNLA